MKIHSIDQKVSQIFSLEGTDVYRIPSYQRRYSWKTEQLETLIDDIEQEEIGYYIGNLLTTSKRDGVIDIVDGQQRLTTIALIFLGIYEVMRSFGEKYDFKKGRYMSNIQDKLIFEGTEKQRYQLLPKDNDTFKELLLILSGEYPSRLGNLRFFKRYKEIVEKLSEFSFEKLIEFYDKVNNLQFLVITVDGLNDAYSIFSALNSKGLKLTLIDLLKNEYLRTATSGGLAEDDAVARWNKFVEIFSEQDLNESEVTQFLLNNYDGLESSSNSSTTKGKALPHYVSLFDKQKHPYLDILGKRAEWFLYLKHQRSDKHHDSIVNKLVRELVHLDASQSFPLLLLLFSENRVQISDNDLRKILNVIKKFFVIRNVTLRPKASNIRSAFMLINREIQDLELKGEGVVNFINNELVKIVDSNEEFRNQLIHSDLYDRTYDTTRFILITLERIHGSYFDGKANPDRLDEYKSKSVPHWSIEHILPQGDSLPAHWLEELNISAEDSDQIIEENVHRLGNLTLTPYNPELGQMSFIRKRDFQIKGNYLGLKLDLHLNKSISPDGDISNITKWTINDIDRRSRTLADEVVTIFGLKE